MKWHVTLVMIGMLALLAACAPASLPSPTDTQPGPDTEEPRGTTRPGGAGSEPVIILKRGGGLAGVADEWTIYADGRIVAGNETEQKVTPDQVSLLLAGIEGLGFFDLENNYGRGSTCNDCFTYELTVRSGERVKTITAVDGAADTPAELLQIVQMITELVSR